VVCGGVLPVPHVMLLFVIQYSVSSIQYPLTVLSLLLLGATRYVIIRYPVFSI
jgi:hypothetical protein